MHTALLDTRGDYVLHDLVALLVFSHYFFFDGASPLGADLTRVTRNPDKMDKPSTGIFRCVSRDLNTRLVHFVRVFCWGGVDELDEVR